MDRTRAQFAVGVDLGGTKVAAGVFDAEGRARGKLAVFPSRAEGPAEGTRDSLFEAIDAALVNAGVDVRELAGIGIGSPGPLDPRAGKILVTPNMPQMGGFPLVSVVRERYRTPVEMSNDGNCFALAEACVGAGKGASVVLGVTLGTGCGVGVVIQGKLLEGPTASTGEVYLAVVGDRTYDEALSGPGLERLWRELTGTTLSGPEITARASAGDPQSRKVFRAFGEQCAKGLGVFAAVLDPEVIVLGGSVAAAFEHFGDIVRREIARYVSPSVAANVRIVPSELGPGAGAIGAASLVFSGGRLA
jgi:glucokinase